MALENSEILMPVLAIAGSLLAGTVLFVLSYFFLIKNRLQNAKNEAEKLTSIAAKEAESIKKEARVEIKEDLLKLRHDFEDEFKERKNDIRDQTRRIAQKEENLDQKLDKSDKREVELNNRTRNLDRREAKVEENAKEIDKIIEDKKAELQRVAGMTADEAKNTLIESMKDEARVEGAKMIKAIEDEARDNAENVSKNIIALAIQRYGGDYVAEKTVSVVNLPSDEMKGRIIGREGRNIRTLEAATGVDLIIDDTPETVILSGHNPVRREVARRSLEKLISDGRIHPARIEEIVEKTEKEITEELKQTGQQITLDVNVHGIHPELVKLLGRLKYRTSFTQNNLAHSQEVAFMCGIMAAELNTNVKKAKRAGLLHDIGKAVDHEVEGSHAQIGADLARKYGESEEIVAAIGEHHNDKQTTLLGTLVQAADALSAARPGARREMLENYIQRLESLEKIVKGFPGISKAFAIQAGRELRIIVDSEKSNDSESVMLASDIAKRIQDELSYPGQIKVTVIRETRAVDFAK
jgi:ribonucrease Y